jgi:hypothetical protein
METVLHDIRYGFLAIGLAGAFASMRVVSGLLFGVTAKDPLTFCGCFHRTRSGCATGVLSAGPARNQSRSAGGA